MMDGCCGLHLPPPGVVRCVFRTSLLFVLVFLHSSIATAQVDEETRNIETAELSIEAIVGWDSTVDRSTPIPVSFLISNTSNRIIEGRLTLSDPDNGREVDLGEIVVSPGATKRFTSIQALTEWGRCLATLREGEDVLWRRQLVLTTGQEFVPNANFALFIDDGGRELKLPNSPSEKSVANLTGNVIGGERGRPVRCLTAKPWQVPNHPGPLVVIQAMIFPESANVANLNRVQWRSVAKWICQGGVVFVHSESREIIKQLIDSSPLGAEPPVQQGQFAVQRVGLGAIHEYPQPLLASEGSESRGRISEITAKLTKEHISGLVSRGFVHNDRGGRADENRLWVVSFFGIYTLLSGVVALLLFRQSQRRIATYTIFVVVAASILSGLLGARLRHSQGDLHWITVTQAGAGGVVQTGKIVVQSAGSRNTQVAVKGEHSDLQLIGRSWYLDHLNRYYGMESQQRYFAFTWQPNLADEADVYQVNVPTSPWGRRHLIATAYQRDLPRLEFELDYKPGDPQDVNDAEQSQSALPTMPSGLMTLKLVNHLPFDLTECRLVIGVTWRLGGQIELEQANSFQNIQDGQLQQRAEMLQLTEEEAPMIDVYQMHRISKLPAGANFEEEFRTQFIKMNAWDMNESWGSISLILPKISHLGAASAWLIGRVKNSPVLSIDEQRSDFVPQQQLHLFVQEILPEDMPDVSLFMGEKKAEPAEETEQTDP